MDSSTVGQLAGIVIAVLFGLGLYIWSSLALSGVFRKVGEERWQAWVPVWNSAVLLRIGGYSPWLVLLALVPVLGQVAFLVVFVMACHRITRGFGYGPGMTVVAALCNPIWASVLAWGGATWSGQPSARPAAPPPVAPWPAQPVAQPPQGYPPQVQQWGSPAQQWGSPAQQWTPPAQQWPPPAQQWPPPAAAAPQPVAQWRPVNPATPHEDDARVSAGGAVAGPGSEQAPAAGPPDPPAPPTPASGPSPNGSGPSPSPATAPLSIGDWSTDTGIPAFVPPPTHAPPVAPGAPSATPVVEPVAPTPPAPPVPPPATAPPASDPLAELRWAPPPDVFRAAPSAETPPLAGPPPAAPELLPDWAPPAPLAAPETGEPEPVPFEEPDTRTLEPAAAVAEPDDHTVLASRLRPSWTLVTSTELELALTGSEVLLGRQPAFDPGHPGAQLLILPDPTRTVSKVHALLRLVDGEWLVRDLGSTNGVTLVAPDGTERMLGLDAEEPLTARFFLGDAEFALREGPPRP